MFGRSFGLKLGGKHQDNDLFRIESVITYSRVAIIYLLKNKIIVGVLCWYILDAEKLTGMPCKLSSPGDIDDIIHKVVAMNVNWNDDEWNFNANDFDNNDWWNEGNVFLFPDTVYFSRIIFESFCFLWKFLFLCYFSTHPISYPLPVIFLIIQDMEFLLVIYSPKQFEVNI